MKHITYGRDKECIAWAAARAGVGDVVGFDPYARAIGVVEDDGRIIAAAVFYYFEGSACRLSLASDGSRRWLTREFIVRVFAYPFVQCRLNRISCEIPVSNVEAIALCQHFGFRLEGTKRMATLTGKDVLIFGLLRDECRWLDPRQTRKAA
jgi:RimJ/RimL family protein N-acetyltransferase